MTWTLYVDDEISAREITAALVSCGYHVMRDGAKRLMVSRVPAFLAREIAPNVRRMMPKGIKVRKA